MFMWFRKQMQRRKGFTLVELMVVIAIIGILAAVAVPKFTDTTASANGAKVLSDLATIDTAISQYMANNGGSVPTYAQLTADTTYLTAAPAAPSGTIKIKGNAVTGTGGYGITSGRATYNGKTAEEWQNATTSTGTTGGTGGTGG